MSIEKYMINDNPFENWDFKKHLGLIAVVYSTVTVISNITCFTGCAYKEQKRINSSKGIKGLVNKRLVKKNDVRKTRKNFIENYLENPPHICRVINAIIGVCLIVDLAAYPLFKKIVEKFGDAE